MRYAKKSLGQNFLVDKNIVNKIINISDIAGKKKCCRNRPWKRSINKSNYFKKTKSNNFN